MARYKMKDTWEDELFDEIQIGDTIYYENEMLNELYEGEDKKEPINLKDINEKDNFIQAFRDYTFNRTENTWIEGGNWDHENWGGMLPSKLWIDSVTSKNPVLVTRIDGHMALSNSAALKAAGINKLTRNPP